MAGPAGPRGTPKLCKDFINKFLCQLHIDKLLQDTEATFTNHLESGDRKKAMNRLKVPPLGDKLAKPWTTFKLGFFSGAFIILLGSVVLSGFFSQR